MSGGTRCDDRDSRQHCDRRGAGCSPHAGDDDDGGDGTTATRPPTAGDQRRHRRPTGTAARPATLPASAPSTRPRRRAPRARRSTDGELVVATGEPAFPPYVIDDAPESGQGFEAAVAYAVAGGDGLRARCGDLGPHDVRRRHPARPEGLRLQPPAVLDHPRARRGRQLQPAVLRRQPGDPRLRRLAPPPAPTSISDFQAPQDRRRRRHDEPDVRHGRAPADVRPVRLQRQRGGQAGARHQADRRHRRRPPDGAVHHRRRDRGLRGVRPVPVERGQPRASRGACCSPRTTRSSSAPTSRSTALQDVGDARRRSRREWMSEGAGVPEIALG